MKYCPKCGNRYDNETSFCLVDGEPLPQADPQAETLKLNQAAPGKTDNASLPDPPLVEYVVKKVWVDEGNYFDFRLNTNRARISIKGIVEENFPATNFSSGKEYGAIIQVTREMGAMHGGADTIQSSSEEYIVPVKNHALEERRSIFSFFAEPGIFQFFRIFVEHINIQHKRVELNIAYVWYTRQ